MNSRIRILILFGLLLAAPILSTVAQEPGKQFAPDTALHYKYLLYLPSDYVQDGTTYPLIFFLHGAGERGSNLTAVKTHGPPKIVASATTLQRMFGADGFPFMVVSPQCPANEWWLNESINEVLNEVLDKYPVDRRRIYMTGLSMGGFGTWSFASAYPQLIAAAAPICGASAVSNWSGLKTYTSMKPPDAQLENLIDIPIWAFHGQNDSVVPVKLDQKTVDQVTALGGNVQFTIYPNTDHDSWTKTYNNLELYQWFLSNVKPESNSSVCKWRFYP